MNESQVGTYDEAFENFLAHLHGRLSNLNAGGNLIGIHVGDEIDATLSDDPTAWNQWTTFFDEARAKINSL